MHIHLNGGTDGDVDADRKELKQLRQAVIDLIAKSARLESEVKAMRGDPTADLEAFARASIERAIAMHQRVIQGARGGKGPAKLSNAS